MYDSFVSNWIQFTYYDMTKNKIHSLSQATVSLSMGTCGRRFRVFFFHQIVDFSTKSSLVYQKLFCLIALLVFECYFHFESGTSDYLTMLGDENKHSIITG